MRGLEMIDLLGGGVASKRVEADHFVLRGDPAVQELDLLTRGLIVQFGCHERRVPRLVIVRGFALLARHQGQRRLI